MRGFLRTIWVWLFRRRYNRKQLQRRGSVWRSNLNAAEAQLRTKIWVDRYYK